MTEREWIEKLAGDAQRASKEYGYLVSVLLAQSCQETGYGATDLSQEGRYNVVGMKTELLNSTWTSDHWDGVSTYEKRTPEWYNGRKTYITDSFRVYSSYYHGLADFCQFLHDARYSVGGQYKYRDLLGTKDPYTLIEGVRSRGYCTDPGYTDSVMAIIKKHNLTQYDVEEEEKTMVSVSKPDIIDRIAENAWQVPYHNSNDAEYLAIHYLGVNGSNPDLYNNGYGGHFYVDENGQCYQAAKVSDEIWHVGKGGYEYIHDYARNYNTIGIECQTHTASGRNKDGETWYFTQETQEACAHLAAWILYHYNIPFDHMLRHGDITTKNCPAPLKRDQGIGSNWTWEQFRNRVAEYLNGSAPSYNLTPEQKIVATGQMHVNVFTKETPEKLKTDGVLGKKTLRGMAACIQEACNRDYNSGLEVDGIIGPKTREALAGHYVKKGETQYLVTCCEILAYCKGRPNVGGVEYPGVYGDGLSAALGSEYMTATDILALLD